MGGEAVKGGVYLNLTRGEFVNVPDEGGELPGTSGTKYLKVNPAVALLVGPIAGLAFVIILPALAPIYIGYALTRKAWSVVRGGERVPARHEARG
jgi:hypothetical protein